MATEPTFNVKLLLNRDTQRDDTQYQLLFCSATLFTALLSVVIPDVIMLNIILLNVIALCVVKRLIKFAPSFVVASGSC
jgi:hypothetical protein